jgi:hypothetical protein
MHVQIKQKKKILENTALCFEFKLWNKAVELLTFCISLSPTIFK